jgi:hypothetical protein
MTPATTVYLGNRAAVEERADPDDTEEAAADQGRPLNRVRVALPGKRCTTISIPADMGLLDAAYSITHPQRGVWAAHSDKDSPAWVASTNPALADLLAAHWQCEKRDPEPDTSEGV